MRSTRTTPALLLLGALSSAAAVAAEQSPAGPWRTITTEHFRVHYPEPFGDWADSAAARIESIHGRVVDTVGFEPDPRIDVLIMDPVAEANGMALPLLDRPGIVLWTQPPGAESAIGYYRDWPELLLTHEIAHIVHLNRPRSGSSHRLARLAPIPIGPLARRAPRWVSEGYATLVEGELTSSGRPNGAFRAMVLRQFAVQGKLPTYGAINGSEGWLSGSMAYLVGSTFLEWLSQNEEEGSLVRLWKRMASRRGGTFDEAFVGVFGDRPADRYARFVAEITADAINLERAMKAAGLVEGERWQRLKGLTSSLDLSPDGRYLLALRSPERGQTEIVVYSLEPTEIEQQAEARRKEREAELLQHPDEVADKPVEPRPRTPPHRLGSVDGQSGRDPRFLSDGGVLFARRSPDGEGVLHWDLHRWEPETGRQTRITRWADVRMADPAPDDSWAVAVQSRHGLSRLVRVDLRTGETRPMEVPGEVFNHPRLAPDGGSVVALRHHEGAWGLVRFEVDSPTTARAVPTPGSPAGPPAFLGSQDILITTDASGTWNLQQISPADSQSTPRTQLVGGALGPAVHPNGRDVYFLSLTEKGVDIRTLAVDTAPPVLAELTPYPVGPPPPPAAPDPHASETTESEPYRVGPSHGIRLPVIGELGARRLHRGPGRARPRRPRPPSTGPRRGAGVGTPGRPGSRERSPGRASPSS